MKTTANALVRWTTVAVVLWTQIAVAGPLSEHAKIWLGTAVVGQATPSNHLEDKMTQATDLLRRARQAMAENNLTAAESLIAQAEALDVQYGTFHMGDTPKKARRDLERKRTAMASPTKPSQILTPLGIGKNRQAPGVDPFAGRSLEPPAGTVAIGQVTPLPRVESASPTRSLSPQQLPSGSQFQQPTTQPGENDMRTPSAAVKPTIAVATYPATATAVGSATQTNNNRSLRDARLALAVGDVRRASDLTQKARALGIDYAPQDDNPDKVEAVVRKYQELSTLDNSTEAYRRAYARNMMEQADALLRWGEYDEAERLVSRAAGIPLAYGPFEAKPQDLLERIAAARRTAGSAATRATPGHVPLAIDQPASVPGDVGQASGPAPSMAARRKAVTLVQQARDTIAVGQLDRAEDFARQAEQLRLPESAFAPGDDRPSLVLLDIQQLRQRVNSGVIPAGGQSPPPTAGGAALDRGVARAVYNPANDPTRNRPAASQQLAVRLSQRPQRDVPSPPEPLQSAAIPSEAGKSAAKTSAMSLFEQGEAALRDHNTDRAYQLFRQASANINELDPITAQRLQDHLQLLSAPSYAKPQTGQAPTMADETVARQQVLARQISAELAHKEANARAMRESDPKGALTLLEEAKKKVESSALEPAARDQLLRRVDRAIGETRQFLEENRPQLELADKNSRVSQQVEREQRTKVEIHEKLALLIDEFNKLMEEQRYDEAHIVAKRTAELDPKNPVVVQLLWQDKLAHRLANAQAVEAQKEQAFIDTLYDVDRSSVALVGDQNPMVFADAKTWGALTKSRQRFRGDNKRPRTEREIEIEKRLRTPVSIQFTNAPLSQVLEYLAKLAEINIVPDPQGLAEEGITSDTQVTIDVQHEIMLKSALNLILQPLHLSYVVKDEVLKITSEQMRDGQVYRVTYNVADLVIPIPNFVPGPTGLQSAYNAGMAAIGNGGGGLPFSSSPAAPMTVVASRDGRSGSAEINSTLLAQMPASSRPSAGPPSKLLPVGAGPGSLGGGAGADFDSLIDIITSTVSPSSWDNMGGPGSIQPYETNLSLIISQTQEIHEEIADLLKQLRTLQDLQIAVELRFITLSDNFFERVGVSFDFNINASTAGKGVDVIATSAGSTSGATTTDRTKAIVVGLTSPSQFSSDLDIPFQQGSFELGVPQFGVFDASAGASLGFAILSDIEAFFFINAAQADRRSNLLQAPKVTLFNGQQASVMDASQSPFVTSVVPVVGDFAAAQQPVIVVLSEGSFLTVQAVISSDRRFVRLTLVPYFSSIKEVNEFQFTGSSTTTTDSSREGLQAAATDPTRLWNKKGDVSTTSTSGTTVQLPTLAAFNVSTTVSVPDGGTILLGGIKRLSEGRTEAGVPGLDKIPYVNRLFKNVAIGRDTQSILMMVTPRIIIQEEEEEKLGTAEEEQ